MPEKSFIVTPAGRHLRSRVEAVMAIYKEHGHVNRTLISEKLALTKLQSSQLLREFLSAHAPVLEWDNIHQSYKAHSKFKAHGKPFGLLWPARRRPFPHQSSSFRG